MMPLQFQPMAAPEASFSKRGRGNQSSEIPCRSTAGLAVAIQKRSKEKSRTDLCGLFCDGVWTKQSLT